MRLMWRMLRWTLTGVSLLLCAAAVALWVRSYSGSDYVMRSAPDPTGPQSADSPLQLAIRVTSSRTWRVQWTRGSVRLIDARLTMIFHVRDDLPKPPKVGPTEPEWSRGTLGEGHVGWEDLPVRTFWNRLGFYRFTGGMETSFSSEREEGIAFPAWVPVAVFAVWPGWVVWRWWRRRGRYGAGLCGACGYDLRGTPGRCPECGAGMGAGG